MTQEIAASGRTSSEHIDSAPLPTYSTDQIAYYLMYDYWRENGQEAHFFNTETVYYNVSGLSFEGRVLAEAALATWSDVTGIRFVSDQYNIYSPTIQFEDDPGGAYSAYVTTSPDSFIIQSALVNVPAEWLNAYGTGYNSYSFQTYLHEIGHALGLGHAGNYNETAIWSANGGGGNHYVNDSWQATVMSYFSQDENTSINASEAFVVGPMMADIAAMQHFYGYGASTRPGDTTYGFNSNSLAQHNFALYEQFNLPAFTIFDTSGRDTLDASGFTANQRLDLRSGQYSDVGGEIGNIGIYSTSIIENAVGGAGWDIITGNQANNFLVGGAGGDQINGGDGSDTLWGNRPDSVGNFVDGADALYGEGGNDLIYGNQGNDFVAGGSDADTIFGGLGNDTLWGNASTAVGNFADGVDQIWGQGGDDVIYGNQNNDSLFGGEGLDTIYGGLGNDTIWGNDPSAIGNFPDLGDYLHGQDGDDLIYGNQGNDVVTGGGGEDRIYGGLDHDTLWGGDSANPGAADGNDTIFGQGGNDLIHGNLGDDSLHGEDGQDIIYGDFGNDGLVGGAANDTFVFEANWGFDAIVDFVAGIDLLDFRALASQNVHTISDVAFSYYNSNLVVEFGGSNIQLLGYGGSLQNSDFLFA